LLFILSAQQHSDGPVFDKLMRNVGKRVHVDGYCDGTLVFYGPHKVG
jgi:hypothetical protein